MGVGTDTLEGKVYLNYIHYKTNTLRRRSTPIQRSYPGSCPEDC